MSNTAKALLHLRQWLRLVGQPEGTNRNLRELAGMIISGNINYGD